MWHAMRTAYFDAEKSPLVCDAVAPALEALETRFGAHRVFLRAPLHHHFEMKGWPETQVVVRFWILGILCAFVALGTLKLR